MLARRVFFLRALRVRLNKRISCFAGLLVQLRLFTRISVPEFANRKMLLTLSFVFPIVNLTPFAQIYQIVAEKFRTTPNGNLPSSWDTFLGRDFC